MYPNINVKLAQAHREALLQQASPRRTAHARIGRRRVSGDVVVRVLQPDDRVEIGRLFKRMSVRSRYMRYFAPLRTLPNSTLQQLAAIDHVRHEAVGAFVDGALIGASHYIVSADDSTSAEISVEVADRHQGKGVATLLLSALVDRARAHGVDRFTATALRQNHAILPLARGLGWPIGVQTRGYEVVLGLCLADV